MSVPTLVKTWQFVADQQITAQGTAIADNRLWVLGVKNALIGFASNPWAVQYSCSSTVAGTAGDGVDRWASSANLVWANAGSAHSWIVLKQTGIASNFQLLISLEAASGSGSILTVVVSPNAGFTGGSTTARPTATDEVVVTTTTSLGSADQSLRYTVMQSTDGECTRIVGAWAGSAQLVGIFDKPANPVSGWTVPFVSAWSTSLAAANLSGNSASMVTRANSASCGLLFGCEGGSLATSQIVTENTVGYGNIANELSGEWPIAPLGVIGRTSGARGRHGSMVDLWYGSTGASSGDTYPATGLQFAQFGSLVIPWDGVTTPHLS